MIGPDTLFAIVFWTLVIGCVGTAAFFFWHAVHQPDHDLIGSSSDADCAIPTIQPPHADWN